MANGKGATQQSLPQDIHRDLVTQMHHSGRQFLDEWLYQMGQANNHASAPAEESHSYWVLALAGNLLWAASCFVPGAGIVARTVGTTKEMAMSEVGKVMYVAMSHGGAVLGAGTVDQLASGPSGDPSGKDVVQRELNAKRNQLGENFHQHVEEWASKLANLKMFKDASWRNQEDFMEAADQFLWASMFPSIGYNDTTTMYNGALQKLNGVLADFNRQYRAWKDKAKIEGHKEFLKGPYANLEGGVGEQGDVADWMSSHPFNPKLVFDLPGEEAGPGRIIRTPYGTLRWTGTSWKLVAPAS